jgi:hypothetical protein
MKHPVISISSLGLLMLLTACGDEGPIAETADASPPVVETEPGVGEIYGRWAAEAEWCMNAPDNTILIRDGRFEGKENSCEMSQPERNGEGWLVNLDCRTAGMETDERVRLTPQGEELRITYIDRQDANEVHLQRCATP